MADILRQYQGKLCSLLDGSSDTLESLTVELYSNYIIDESVKNNVLREKGYTGARILLDTAIVKIKQSPGAKDAVFKAMETQGILQQVVTEIRAKEGSFTPPRYSGNEKEMEPPTAEAGSATGSTKTKNEHEVLKEAEALQDKFDHLLDEVGKYSTAICNVKLLQLRLNCHLTRARENTAAVKAVLSDIDQIEDSSKILNCLIRCDLIGYMNYRLLDVFQKLIQKPQLDQLVQEYEDTLVRFLKSADLGTLAQVFDSNPTVAPVTFAGLPRFMIHLNDSWEGKSVYCWDQLLKGQFRWRSNVQIVRISKNCIIIVYGVLPFFVPDVVRDLTNPEVLSLLEEQGVTKIELSEQLKEIAKEEENLDVVLLEAAEHYSDTEIMESLLKRGANVHVISTEYQKCSPLHLAAVSGNCAAVTLLIEYGADIDKGDISGRTPLHYAAKKGKNEVVKLLLEAGANIHKANEYGYTTLHYAVSGNVETVELVLNSGAITDINKKDQLQRNPLHHAAEKGHNETVALLVKSGANFNKKDKYGNTPLHLAISHGMKETVELLLSYNADYTIQNKDGQTILHSAIESGDIETVGIILKLCDVSYLHKKVSLPNSCTPLHCAVNHEYVEIVELLLKSGADHSIGDENGRTPLFVAFEKCHERIVELLLQAGADPNRVVCYSSEGVWQLKDENKCTLLHYAVQKNNESMVELLLKYGANANEKPDSKGHTPFYVAFKKGHTKIAESLLQAGADPNAVDEVPSQLHAAIKSEQYRFAEVLLQFGADPNVVDKNGCTPLHIAVERGHDRIAELLLQAGANAKAVDKVGSTPLHYAAKKGQYELITLLVKSGANVNKKDMDGNTPLHCAASHGHKTTVEVLLSCDADYAIRNKDGQTILHSAVEGNNMEIIELFLKLCDTSYLNKQSSSIKYMRDVLHGTPLHYAVHYGHVDTVQLLLKSGADHSIEDESGLTPLHIAAKKGNDRIAELLLQAGANPKAVDKSGHTPLHITAETGNDRIANLLLQAGADPKAVDKSSLTPLHISAQRGNDRIAELLLQANADPKAMDKSGLTPLHIAAERDHGRITELLLQAGADPKAVDKRGRTPLHSVAAAEWGGERVAEFLLHASADPKAVDERGQTPLHIAAKNNHDSTRIAELLLQAGADPNAVDKEGFTPLHSAIMDYRDQFSLYQIEFKSIMDLLLKYGANINAKDTFGFTPLHCAVKAGKHLASTQSFPKSQLRRYRDTDREIVRLLLTKGANVNEQDKDGHTPMFYAKQLHNEDVVELLLPFETTSKDEQIIVMASSTKSESFHNKSHPLPLSHPFLAATKAKEYKTTETDPSSTLTEQDKDSESVQ